MDYGKILRRAWEIVRNNLFLIVLGVLVILGTGGGSSSGGSRYSSPSNSGITATPVPGQELPSTVPGLPQIPDIPKEVLALGVGVLVAIVVVLFIIGLVLWVISCIATGGLIAGVDQIEREGTSSFSQSWRAGWQKGWRMIGISFIPSIPTLIGLALIIVVLLTAGGLSVLIDDPDAFLRNMSNEIGLWVAMGMVLCISVLFSIVLDILAGLAGRACMLEDKGVIESYGRGWEVLSNNFGSAFVLALIQIGISLGLGVLLCLPAAFLAICCFLLPILWVINGAIQAYFSTVWTLAWRQWTGGEPAGSFVIEKAPAV